jgi:ribosomal protein L11 methylase PrmA
MVIANLRYPSLKRFYPRIKRLTGTGGHVILSGFRPGERDDLIALYRAGHFECIWTADELNWSAAVFKKGHAS